MMPSLTSSHQVHSFHPSMLFHGATVHRLIWYYSNLHLVSVGVDTVRTALSYLLKTPFSPSAPATFVEHHHLPHRIRSFIHDGNLHPISKELWKEFQIYEWSCIRLENAHDIRNVQSWAHLASRISHFACDQLI